MMMVVTITTIVMIMWEMMMMLVVVVVVGASDKDRCSGILEIFLPPLIILSCNRPPLMSQHYSYAMHLSIFLGLFECVGVQQYTFQNTTQT